VISVIIIGSGYFASRGKVAFRTIWSCYYPMWSCYFAYKRHSSCYVTWYPHVIIVYECIFVQFAGVLG